MKVLSGIIPEGAFFNSFDTVKHFIKSLKGHLNVINTTIEEDLSMRTMGKTENKKNMHENEMKVVSRMKAYQKLAERAISRKRPNRHMIRRG